MLTVIASASAQLTVKQVLEKASKSISLKDGIKGKLTMKTMGIGETVDFAADETRMYSVHDNELSWDTEKVSYTVDTKKKTLTIEDGSKDFAMLLLPFEMSKGLLDGLSSGKTKESEFKMKTEKTVYSITSKKEGASMEIDIDKQTFYPVRLKMGKGLISMTISMSNLTKLTDKSILNFDKSKYASYKVIDERGKDKKKEK